MNNQTNYFLQEEGDAWYERNRIVSEKVSPAEEDWGWPNFICDVLYSHSEHISRILEGGSSDGAKLEKLCDFFAAEGTGFDPSRRAVEAGNKRFSAREKNIRLSVGVGREISSDSDAFDLVIIGFFLYITGRSDLRKTMIEFDRVLRPGGFLVVVDFEPETPHSNEYHHKPGFLTYKNTYANFFTGLSDYVVVAKAPLTDRGDLGFVVEEEGRVAVTILWKKSEPYPQRDGPSR